MFNFINSFSKYLDGFRLSLRKSDKLQIDSEFTIPLEVIKIFKKIKSKEEVIKNWEIDRVFTPQICEEKRVKKIKEWHKAVGCSYGWAKED